MSKISLVVFDLSGTTIKDETAVPDCLYKAALEFGLDTTHEEIMRSVGTNKIHLYQYLIAKSKGIKIELKDLESFHDSETEEEAKRVFERYTEIMIDYYKNDLKPMPGAEDTFQWLHENGIKVATDTGFHRDVTNAIMEGTGWIKNGLVDIAVDVEHTPGAKGRPAPFMIYHAMTQLNIQSIHEVVKVGDAPADMLEGYNAGCKGVVGVLTGALPIEQWGKYFHTHVIPSVKELPDLLKNEFLSK